MPDTAAVQEATLQRYLAAWKIGSAQGMLETLSSSVKQRTMPLGLGLPSRAHKDLEVVLPMMYDYVADWKLDVQQVIHDTAQNKASVFANASGVTPFGEYNSEVAVFLEFDAAGEKIIILDEMMDAIFLMSFYPRLKQYLMDKNSASKK